MKKMIACLWFDKEAEEAAKFYCSVFKKSKMGRITRYGNEGQEIHGGKPGSVLTVDFELDGRPFVALNGGPIFNFNEAVSFQIPCKTQKELDYYWEKLSAGGDPKAQQCGWLKDKYGLSWQVFPETLPKMLQDKNRAKADRAMKAMMAMKKFDFAELKKAYEGK